MKSDEQHLAGETFTGNKEVNGTPGILASEMTFGSAVPSDRTNDSEESENRSADRGRSNNAIQPLLSRDQRQELAHHWLQIQSEFVDRPRESVKRADGLVLDVMHRVTSGFAREREQLEAQWEQGDDVSTEDLRAALTRYRSFFSRLLSV